MKPTEKQIEIKHEPGKPKATPKQLTDREKFEQARKALYEYWKRS
jgi:hypothetical protein